MQRRARILCQPAKATPMKKYLLILLFAACAPSVEKPDTGPLANSILGRWNFIAKQAPGYGPPGEWTTPPAGQYITLDSLGNVGGNLFTDVTGYQLVDSATVKFLAPTQAAGFYLFNYRLDTLEKAFYLYVRPSNGGYCFEGCGTYKFGR